MKRAAHECAAGTAPAAHLTAGRGAFLYCPDIHQTRCRSIGGKPQEAHDYAGGLAAYDRHRAIRTRKWRGAFVTRLTVWTTTTFSTPLNPNWRSLTLRIFLRRGTKWRNPRCGDSPSGWSTGP